MATGRWTRFGSIAMRLVVPLLSYLVVSSSRKCDPVDVASCNPETTLKIGLLTGAVIVSTIDVAFLSTEAKAKVAPGATATLTPSLVVDRHGAALGVGGVF